MNWNEYLNLSEKTLSYNFFSDKETEILLHGIMGVITELEELIEWKSDKVGKSEEIADVFWYLAIFSRKYNDVSIPIIDNIKLSEKIGNYIFRKNRTKKVIIDLYKTSSLLMDIYKKKIFYNKEINDKNVIELANKLLYLSCKYCNINNISVSDSLNKNILKLKQRYGDKFSTEKAINRDIETERNILEGK